MAEAYVEDFEDSQDSYDYQHVPLPDIDETQIVDDIDDKVGKVFGCPKLLFT